MASTAALQALAAVLGGTQSLHTNSMDETLALPTQEAVTLALALVCQDDFGNLPDKSDSPSDDRLSKLQKVFRSGNGSGILYLLNPLIGLLKHQALIIGDELDDDSAR